MTNISSKSKKLTPCKTVKMLLKKQHPNVEQYDLLTLTRMRDRSEGKILSQRILNLLQSNPGIANLVDDTNGYNALHYACLNPMLAKNIRVVSALVNASEKLGETQNNEEMKLESLIKYIQRDESASQEASSNAQILRHKTLVYGELPLHILCKNAYTTTLDVFEYVLHSYPRAVFSQDKIRLHLPLHDLCKACTEHPISLEFVLLLVQSWPTSCQVRNRGGNLPLHLASIIVKEQREGEENEKVRFENQLEILKYLVDLYPEGLEVKNKHGLTPLQIAISTSEELDNRWKFSFNTKANYQNIIDFLRTDSSCSETASLTTDHESIFSDRKKIWVDTSALDSNHESVQNNQKKLIESFNSSGHSFGIIDTSGRELDDSDDDATPWIDKEYEEATPHVRTEELGSSSHRKQSARRGNGNLGQSLRHQRRCRSYSPHSRSPVNSSDNKTGRRGSFGKLRRRNSRSDVGSPSPHRRRNSIGKHPRRNSRGNSGSSPHHQRRGSIGKLVRSNSRTDLGISSLHRRRGSGKHLRSNHGNDLGSSSHHTPKGVEKYCPFNTWSATSTSMSNSVSSINWNESEDDDNISIAVEALEKFEDYDYEMSPAPEKCINRGIQEYERRDDEMSPASQKNALKALEKLLENDNEMSLIGKLFRSNSGSDFGSSSGDDELSFAVEELVEFEDTTPAQGKDANRSMEEFGDREYEMSPAARKNAEEEQEEYFESYNEASLVAQNNVNRGNELSKQKSQESLISTLSKTSVGITRSTTKLLVRCGSISRLFQHEGRSDLGSSSSDDDSLSFAEDEHVDTENTTPVQGEKANRALEVQGERDFEISPVAPKNAVEEQEEYFESYNEVSLVSQNNINRRNELSKQKSPESLMSTLSKTSVGITRSTTKLLERCGSISRLFQHNSRSDLGSSSSEDDSCSFAGDEHIDIQDATPVLAKNVNPAVEEYGARNYEISPVVQKDVIEARDEYVESDNTMFSQVTQKNVNRNNVLRKQNSQDSPISTRSTKSMVSTRSIKSILKRGSASSANSSGNPSQRGVGKNKLFRSSSRRIDVDSCSDDDNLSFTEDVYLETNNEVSQQKIAMEGKSMDNYVEGDHEMALGEKIRKQNIRGSHVSTSSAMSIVSTLSTKTIVRCGDWLTLHSGSPSYLVNHVGEC